MGLLYDYHVLLTLGFVKGTYGYVEKGRAETLPFSTSFLVQITNETLIVYLVCGKVHPCNSSIIKI